MSNKCKFKINKGKFFIKQHFEWIFLCGNLWQSKFNPFVDSEYKVCIWEFVFAQIKSLQMGATNKSIKIIIVENFQLQNVFLWTRIIFLFSLLPSTMKRTFFFQCRLYQRTLYFNWIQYKFYGIDTFDVQSHIFHHGINDLWAECFCVDLKRKGKAHFWKYFVFWCDFPWHIHFILIPDLVNI